MIPSKEEWHKALVEKQGKDVQASLSKATVLICGLGGLGSNIALMLARAGIGRLILVDFDRVEITNLHRQLYKPSQIGLPKAEALVENLREYAPYIDYESHVQKVTGENIALLAKDADIVCEAFDKAEAKAMLVNTILEQFPQKHLVAASGMAGFGEANLIRTRKISEKFYFCGDFTSDVNDGIGLISSRVTLCAAHEAHSIIRILCGKKD